MRRQTTKTKTPARNFPWTAGQKATTQLVTPTTYDNKIGGFLRNVDTVIKQRTNRYGGKDAVAKRLQKAASSAKGCLRRQNIVCEPMAKSLQQISRSMKGSSVPKNVRSNYQSLLRYLRDQVQTHVISFCRIFQNSLRQTGREFTKIENTMHRQLRGRTSGHYKVDPSIKRQLTALDRRLSSFKTKYTKYLNPLARLGNRSVQSSVNQIKREMDSLKKSIRQSLALVNRVSKGTTKRKTGARPKALISKREITALQNRWTKYERAIQKHNKELQLLAEQLKATQKL